MSRSLAIVVGVAAGWPGKRHSESSPFADVAVERTPPAPHNRVAENGTYPASHVTVHDEPIARVSVQSPTAPLDGGDDASQTGENTYADPLSDPLSSSRYAPMTTVSSSIDTL